MNHLEIQQRDKSALRQGYSAAVRKFEIASIAAYAVTMSWLAIVLMPRMQAKPFLAVSALMLGFVAAVLSAGRSAADAPAPDGWTAAAPRDEIKPAFAFDPAGGPDGKGCLVPNGLAGDVDLVAALQRRLPALDNEALVRAMGSTTDAVFTIWERDAPAPTPVRPKSGPN